ncbi:MAG: M16 family metallopeptidase, partial [Capnocytophaga ochracea]
LFERAVSTLSVNYKKLPQSTDPYSASSSARKGLNSGYGIGSTTQDKTYYYEVFPSNNLQLGLWMEAERMLHPVINEIGVSTQNSVVKEEKNQRIDNAPYGRIMYRSAINPYLFKKHPYSGTVIGEVEHLDAASLEEFIAFKKKFYNPNNAVLVVAGDFDTPTTKKWIEQYFATIPNMGNVIQRNKIEEVPISETIEVTEYDPNIQIPLKLYAYRTPAMTDKDSYTIDLLSNILTDGKSARLYKKMIDEHQTALQVLAFSDAQEDYGVYIMGALPMDGVSLETLAQEMDEEIERLQIELISEREYEKLQNQIEANFVAQNSNMEGIALSLADNYTFYKDTNLINKAIDHYRAITREDIREAARKYLDKNQRLDLNYLPSNL